MNKITLDKALQTINQVVGEFKGTRAEHEYINECINIIVECSKQGEIKIKEDKK
jgi:hypothetical protein